MKKLLLLLLFTGISFGQNATLTGIKNLGASYRLVGIQPAVGGEKAFVLDATGKPKLATFAPSTLQVKSDWFATTGFAEILNKPIVITGDSVNNLFNTVVGQEALFPNTGESNVAIGYQSLSSNNGNNNVAIGNYAMAGNNIGGSNNIAIGSNAASELSGANNSTIIGVVGGDSYIQSSILIGAGGVSRLEVNQNGVVKFVVPPPIYLTNADAVSGGLVQGQIYQTPDFTLKIVN